MKLLQECEILAEARDPAMRMRHIARIARILRDAGIRLSYHNIADYGNLSDDEVAKVFKWNLSVKRNATLDFEIDSQSEAKGDYAKAVAGLLYAETHDLKTIRVVANKAGLDIGRTYDLLINHRRDVAKEFPTFSIPIMDNHK